MLPLRAPSHDIAKAIFDTFHAEFQAFEKLLIRTRTAKARERRKENCHVIFKDVAKPRAMPVQSLAEESISHVHSISPDGLTVHCDKEWPALDQPLFGPNGTLDFVTRSGSALTFERAPALEVGDCIRQEIFTGDVQAVFPCILVILGNHVG